MTADQATALIIAITGLIGALGAIYAQLRATHKLVNGRMGELVTIAQLAALKQGELAGRDWATRASPATPPAEQAPGAPPGTP